MTAIDTSPPADAARFVWLAKNWETQEFGETCGWGACASLDDFRAAIDRLRAEQED